VRYDQNGGQKIESGLGSFVAMMLIELDLTKSRCKNLRRQNVLCESPGLKSISLASIRLRLSEIRPERSPSRDSDLLR